MTVVVGGDDELTAFVGEATRPLVLEALSVEVESTAHALEKCDEDERPTLQARLETSKGLHAQLEQTVGQANLTGPADLISDVLKDATSQATHALDGLVEFLKGERAPLTEEALADLRGQTLSVTCSIEAMIACESARANA